MGINEELDKNEIIKSTKDGIYSKITSPLWGTFILSWLVWNWKILYITIFVDGDKIFEKYTLLKVEYISQKIYDGWLYFFQGPIFLEYLIFWLIGPIISTILILIIIHPLSNYVYIRDIKTFKKSRIQAKKKMENEIEKEFLKGKKEENEIIQQQLTELEKKNKLLEEMEKELKEQEINYKKLEKTRNQLTHIGRSKESEWSKDFKKLMKKHPSIINTLSDMKYKHHGKIKDAYQTYISPDDLKILDINGLFKFSGGARSGEVTEKGVYFIKEFNEIE